MKPKIFCLVLFFINIKIFAIATELTPKHDEVQGTFQKVMFDNFPAYLSGYDDAGSPIWIIHLGRWDVRQFLEKGEPWPTEMDKYAKQLFLRFQETGRNHTGRDLNSEPDGFVIIVDMDGYNLRQFSHGPTLLFLLEMFKNFEEIVKSGDLKAGYVINSNFLFQKMWELGRNYLGNLVSRVEIYGNNPDTWKTRLLKNLPKDQLPEAYGGSKDHEFVEVFG